MSSRAAEPALRLGNSAWKVGAPLRSLCVTRNGRQLLAVASGGNGGLDVVLQVLDTMSGERVAVHSDPGSITAIGRLSTSDDYLVGTTDGLVKVVSPGKALQQMPVPGTPRGISVSRDDRAIVSWTDDSVQCWERSNGERQLFHVEKELIAAAAIDPTSTLIAAVLIPNQLVLWDRATGELRGRMELKGRNFGAIAFSPDGARLVVAGVYGTERCLVYGLRRGENSVALELERTCRGAAPAAISPDGQWLAVVADHDSVKLYSLSGDRRERASPRYRDMVQALAFSPDSTALYFGGDAGSIHHWNVAEKYLTEASVADERGGLLHRVCAASFNPVHPAWLSVGCEDGSVSSWDTSRGGKLSEFSFEGGQITSIDHSQDGKLLAIGCSSPRGPDEKKLFLRTGSETIPVAACTETIHKVHFHPRQPLLAVVEQGRNSQPGRVLLLNSTLLNVEHTLPPFDQGDPVDCAWSPQGDQLAVGYLLPGWEGAVCLFRGPSWRQPVLLGKTANEIECLAFLPDGQGLVSGDAGGQLAVWDLDARRLSRQWDSRSKHLNQLCVTPDGKIVATCDTNGKIRLWSLADGLLRRELDAHWGDVRTLAISSDGQQLASGGDDATVAIWSVKGVE